MSEPFIGEVKIFGGNFAPRGWAFCNGQLLPISQNTALFSILGTTYGGDGRVTFALPNLQARFPLHQGAGPGLTPRTIGEVGGAASHTLSMAEMPQHTHQLFASNSAATVLAPTLGVMAKVTAPSPPYHDAVSLAPMPPGSLSIAGGSQPHNNLQPFLVVNFIIAVQGIFPSRN